MSMLERELESALVKALKGQEFTGADSMWVKPVAGMANAYIAVEIPTASATFADDSQTAHVTPMFRLLVDIGQVEHLLPAEATADMLRFHGRIFGQLWVQRPFDLSDIIPTTIGVRDEVEIRKAVERQVVGRLKIFEDQVDLMAWSIKGLLGLSLELIDGYRLSPLHWKTVLMVLAASGRDGRAAFEHSARLIDAHYGNNIGDAFLKLLDSVPMDRLKLWYLVGADEDPEDFQIQPLPRSGAIVPSRAGWRRRMCPRERPAASASKPLTSIGQPMILTAGLSTPKKLLLTSWRAMCSLRWISTTSTLRMRWLWNASCWILSPITRISPSRKTSTCRPHTCASLGSSTFTECRAHSGCSTRKTAGCTQVSGCPMVTLWICLRSASRSLTSATAWSQAMHCRWAGTDCSYAS